MSSMEKLNREQIMTLPNGVTIIRVVAIPFILFMLFYSGRGYQFITALLFLAAAITDTRRVPGKTERMVRPGKISRP
jgi:phosphatidylglycerophosphate synthase